MSFIYDFLNVFVTYCQEIWLTLAVGFLISGIFFKFIPTSIVEKHLGEKGFKPILIASLSGTLLPVCCIGSLPIAITLRRKGASLGAVLAFLVATPATSISALLVCWRLLGGMFTLYIFIVIIIMALVMGLISDNLTFSRSSSGTPAKDNACCHEEKKGARKEEETGLAGKIKEIFVYSFITLPKDIGVEILIGIGIASFITVFEPIQHLIRDYLTGPIGYVFVLVVGVLTYVCSTASVPMADALMVSGLSKGQALCYLLVGPITSYGTILVIKKEFGRHVLIVYLTVICVLSLMFGLLFDAINV